MSRRIPWWGLIIDGNPEKNAKALKAALEDTFLDYKDGETTTDIGPNVLGFYVRRVEEVQRRIGDAVAHATGAAVTALDISDDPVVWRLRNGKWDIDEDVTPQEAIEKAGLPLPWDDPPHPELREVTVFEGVSADELAPYFPGKETRLLNGRVLVRAVSVDAEKAFYGRPGYQAFRVTRRVANDGWSVMAMRSKNDVSLSTTEDPTEILGEHTPLSLVEKLGIPAEWLQ